MVFEALGVSGSWARGFEGPGLRLQGCRFRISGLRLRMPKLNLLGIVALKQKQNIDKQV